MRYNKKPWSHLIGTRTYSSWSNMKTRCSNPKYQERKYYSERGIFYAPAWEDFGGFLDDMGVCPEGMSLERIDNDKGYSKENCKWATPFEQSNHRPGFNRMLTLDGETKNLMEWSRITGLKPSTISMRITYGWSEKEALTTKLHENH